MRIDPAAVFAHTLASLPLRVVLVWVAVAFGAVMPGYLQSGCQVLAELGWLALALPFWLLAISRGRRQRMVGLDGHPARGATSAEDA